MTITLILAGVYVVLAVADWQACRAARNAAKAISEAQMQPHRLAWRKPTDPFWLQFMDAQK